MHPQEQLQQLQGFKLPAAAIAHALYGRAADFNRFKGRLAGMDDDSSQAKPVCMESKSIGECEPSPAKKICPDGGVNGSLKPDGVSQVG
jgi:hypothetical protein